MRTIYMKSQNLKRGLKNRHIQLIAIGGAIGTGLFLGAGKSIHFAGPSILLVYLCIGIAVFFMMRALGELLVDNPTTGSFTKFAEQYIGSWAGFITGWTYWFCWVVTGIAEITAIGLYVHFWLPNVPQWIPALICVFLLVLINLATVKAFGEIEFWFALIKIITIIVLIVTGFILVIMKFDVHGTPASFTHLWAHGGFFPHGASGFIFSFQMAIFAFVGIELVGVTAGEAEDPQNTLPKAINSIPLRILVFYIGALLIIMSIYPWNGIDPESSPFVKVFQLIGIPAAAGIINFVVLTSAASSCNSGIFSTSRMLYILSLEGKAPKLFGKLNHRNIPSAGLFASTSVLLIGVLLNYLLDATAVFTLVTSIATICFLWVWGIILIAHLRFRYLNPKHSSTFKMPFAPISNWIVLAFFAFVVVVLGFTTETRMALFVTPVWFIILVLAYLFSKKTK